MKDTKKEKALEREKQIKDWTKKENEFSKTWPSERVTEARG
ncbi:MAG: hypothetical protein ABEI53_03680 [Candidatus Magasanikbacteria bacterium]